jgi:serine/threonine protein kinase
MTLAPGTRLGPYDIVSPPGAGGMGEVYRATDGRLGRDVAIKVVARRLVDDADALARFQREARVVASLSHPNLVALHDVGTEGRMAFAVMELLDGEPLDRSIPAAGLPWTQALDIAASIADALACAHDRCVVRRDLKPANVSMTRDGLVKVLDFGLAKQDAYLAAAQTTRAVAPEATQPGAVLGTVGYMSPEQVSGEATDARSDIFSSGCVLYELLSGRRPFVGATAPEVQAAILRDQPESLATSARSRRSCTRESSAAFRSVPSSDFSHCEGQRARSPLRCHSHRSGVHVPLLQAGRRGAASRSAAARRSGDAYALLARGGEKAFIERHERDVVFERVPQVETARELNRVSAAQGVPAKQPQGALDDDGSQFHDEQSVKVSLHGREGPVAIPVGDHPLSPTPHQRRSQFNRGQPAGGRLAGRQQPFHAQTSRLAHVALGERAGVEVPHQNRSSRSETTAADRLVPRASIGRKGRRPFRLGRTATPWASSSVNTASAPASALMGRSSATGRPRSVTTSRWPRWTRRR